MGAGREPTTEVLADQRWQRANEGAINKIRAGGQAYLPGGRSLVSAAAKMSNGLARRREKSRHVTPVRCRPLRRSRSARERTYCTLKRAEETR